MRYLLLGIVLVFGAFSLPLRAQAFYEVIPDLVPGAVTVVDGVGGSGDLVVGASGTDALMWTPAGGSRSIAGIAGAASSAASAVTSDGRYVTGYSLVSGIQCVFLHEINGMTIAIDPIVTGANAVPTAISADGSTVVGLGTVPGMSGPRAFRWTRQTGTMDLGVLPNGTFSLARDVSADGSTIVGVATDGTGTSQIFHWTSVTGMVPWNSSPSACNSIECADVSAVCDDGTVIVGSLDQGLGPTAIRWRSGQFLEVLGSLPGYRWTQALDVSADGERVVGYAYGPFAPQDVWSRAFYWSAATGMVELRSLLIALGAQGVGSVDELRVASEISADGYVVAGHNSFCPQPWQCPPIRVGWRARLGGLGMTFCAQPTANSVFHVASLRAEGSAVVADDRLVLSAHLLPPNVVGILLAAPWPSLTPSLPAYAGLICLGGAVGRGGTALHSGPHGVFSIPIDLDLVPGPVGPRVVLPGDTLAFQVFYADFGGGPAHWRFSNALRIGFH